MKAKQPFFEFNRDDYKQYLDRPDWREPDNYPKASNTHIPKWKWEFIRRDPEYIASWDELEEQTKSIKSHEELQESEVYQSLYIPICRKFRLETVHCPLYDGNISAIFAGSTLTPSVIPANYLEKNITGFIAQAKTNGHYLISLNPHHRMEEQWQVAKKEIDQWEFEKNNPHYYEVYECPRALETGIAEADPPDPKNTKESRIRPLNFQLYLRLLDARRDPHPKGASWKQIFDHLKADKMNYSKDDVRRLHGKALKTQLKARGW